MPRSKTLIQAFAITSSSCSRPIAANTGLTCMQLAVGVVLCAAMQIEQKELSV